MGDGNQFDNPVYSYQGSTRLDDGTASLLHKRQLMNGFGLLKSAIADKTKLNRQDDESAKGTYVQIL